jgi:hypothetical protein
MAKLEAKLEDQVDDEDSLDLHCVFEFHLFPMWKWLTHAMLKMMNESIYQVLSFGSSSMIPFQFASAL